MMWNDNKFLNQSQGVTITLPFPPTAMNAMDDMEVYARFMRTYRAMRISRPEIAVLTAIQCVADMMRLDDADVARILVDLGLRAPRVSFPETYLNAIDSVMARSVEWEIDGRI